MLVVIETVDGCTAATTAATSMPPDVAVDRDRLHGRRRLAAAGSSSSRARRRSHPPRRRRRRRARCPPPPPTGADAGGRGGVGRSAPPARWEAPASAPRAGRRSRAHDVGGGDSGGRPVLRRRPQRLLRSGEQRVVHGVEPARRPSDHRRSDVRTRSRTPPAMRHTLGVDRGVDAHGAAGRAGVLRWRRHDRAHGATPDRASPAGAASSPARRAASAPRSPARSPRAARPSALLDVAADVKAIAAELDGPAEVADLADPPATRDGRAPR